MRSKTGAGPASKRTHRRLPGNKVSLLTVPADILLEVTDLRKGGILSASAQEITEAVERNAAVSTLVEERECLLVVGRSLSVVLVRSHCIALYSIKISNLVGRIEGQEKGRCCQSEELGEEDFATVVNVMEMR